MNLTQHYKDNNTETSAIVYQRRTNILLGLIVALSIMFVSLEYSMRDSQEALVDDVLDELYEGEFFHEVKHQFVVVGCWITHCILKI